MDEMEACETLLNAFDEISFFFVLRQTRAALEHLAKVLFERWQ